jgi:hypothetical protein
MKKVLLVACCILFVSLSVGCTQQDAIDTWTKNIYPAINNTYDIGSPTLQYQNGYFVNLNISNIISGNYTVPSGGCVYIWDADNSDYFSLCHDGGVGIIENPTGSIYVRGDDYVVADLTGDSAGMYEFQVENSGNVEVASIDTAGNLDVLGYIANNNSSINVYGNASFAKLVLSTPAIDDIRIVPGSFDRPGVSDPAYIAYNPNGGAITTYLTEWQIDDIASFTVQIPHGYTIGTNISVHAHWTAGARGVAENSHKVGWKVDYTWANMDGTFGNMSTASLSDACDGTNHKHQMTPEVTIAGAGKGISSMLICNIKRTDTGTDDTWATNTAGNMPMLLEVDFHFEVDTLGSYSPTEK